MDHLLRFGVQVTNRWAQSFEVVEHWSNSTSSLSCQASFTWHCQWQCHSWFHLRGHTLLFLDYCSTSLKLVSRRRPRGRCQISSSTLFCNMNTAGQQNITQPNGGHSPTIIVSVGGLHLFFFFSFQWECYTRNIINLLGLFHSFSWIVHILWILSLSSSGDDEQPQIELKLPRLGLPASIC